MKLIRSEQNINADWNMKKLLTYVLITAIIFSISSYPKQALADQASTTITVSETGTLVLDTLTQGYTSAQALNVQEYVTLSKESPVVITNLAASLSGGASSKFLMGTVNANSLGAGVSSTQINIRPKQNLAVGTHTETVTITADGGISHSFDVSFIVSSPPSTTITVSETGTLVFDTLTQGYTSTQPKQVTLAKVDTSGVVTNLSVSLSGGANSKFIIGTIQPNSLEAGTNSVQFNIRPKQNLTAGTHTETVSITADGGISHSFTVSFTVIALVNAATPTIIDHPQGGTVKIGDPFVLDVYATISDGPFENIQYQWMSNTINDVVSATSIEGANDWVYEVPTDTPGTMYYFVGVINHNSGVNGNQFSSVISNSAQVTVNPIVHAATPSITLQPEAETVVEGATATLNVAATVTDIGLLSYQWYSNSVDSNNGGTLIVGATSASYSPTTDTIGTNYYYVVVTNTNNNVNGTKTAQITSDAVQVNVIVPLTYSIAVIENQDATRLVSGYASGTQETKSIVVSNTGTGDLTGLTVALSGTGSQSFEITQPDSTLNSGAMDTSFTVKAIDSLQAGTHIATVTISANEMTSVTFTVTQVVSNPSSNNNSSSETTDEAGIVVLVNGKEEQAGIATKSERGNQSVVSIAIDKEKLNAKLESESSNAIVTIPVTVDSDVIIIELNGEIIKSLDHKQAILNIQTEQATYTLPAGIIDIDLLASQLESTNNLESMKLQIEISTPTDDLVQLINDAVVSGGFTQVAPALDFSIRITNGTKTIAITKYKAYVERTIVLNEGVDPSKVTTGLVIEEDGTVRHVPTKIEIKDGKYYAKINSLTNSTYTVVWNPMEFSDMSQHWAQHAVNDIGSRLIINGTGDGVFSPNQFTTRAEFAAIIVRGLGLKLENGNSSYSDVDQEAWYSKAIQTASTYGLINGYNDDSFRPNEVITREEAMSIIAKAMAITGLKAKLQVESSNNILQSYADAEAASTWAIEAIAASIQAGIITGRSDNDLAPQAFITRAEVAIMLQRLLQKSSLI